MLKTFSALPWSMRRFSYANQATLHKLSEAHVSGAHATGAFCLARNYSFLCPCPTHRYRAVTHAHESSQLTLRKYSATPSAVHNDASQDGDAEQPLETGLYLVGTPIGNLEDISMRALRILRTATVVLAEDTRHSRKLLTHFNITAQLYSFHQHNENNKEKVVSSRCRLSPAHTLATTQHLTGSFLHRCWNS